MVRLFINSFDAERLWSTDSGAGTEESTWDEVVIVGPPAKTHKTYRSVEAKQNPAAGSK